MIRVKAFGVIRFRIKSFIIIFFLFRYEREEVFLGLNLPIKSGNLQESLLQFVKDELLDGDNAYNCEKCNEKVLLELDNFLFKTIFVYAVSILIQSSDRQLSEHALRNCLNIFAFS